MKMGPGQKSGNRKNETIGRMKPELPFPDETHLLLSMNTNNPDGLSIPRLIHSFVFKSHDP